MENMILRDHLHNLTRTSAKSTSVIHLQKSLSYDFKVEKRPKPIFIPFFKERDGMGKLLSINLNTESPQSRKVQTCVPIIITPKQRLLTKVI